MAFVKESREVTLELEANPIPQILFEHQLGKGKENADQASLATRLDVLPFQSQIYSSVSRKRAVNYGTGRETPFIFLRKGHRTTRLKVRVQAEVCWLN